MVPGRDENGRFKKGHSGGPGRPKRTTEEKYLAALLGRVKLEDWRKIVDTAVSRAKAGDDKARQWLSDYILGKPVQNVNADLNNTGELVIRVLYGDDGTDGQAT